MASGFDISDDPPDENEEYESLDESLDDDDALGFGPEGARDLDSELTVDQAELEEIGAAFDDPDRIALLDGGMDDPDGVGPRPPLDVEAGWDVDPTLRAGSDPYDADSGQADYVDADGDAVSTDSLLDVPDLAEDPELDILSSGTLEDVADDAPGSDSARW